MGEYKRPDPTTISTFLLICGIWLACLVALFILQPQALQANKIYQLGTFAAHTNKLAASLQKELALAAGKKAGSTEVGDSALLTNAVEQTDFDRHDVAKNWGRFNSDPYSPSLRHLVESALTNLEGVERVLNHDALTGAKIAGAAASYGSSASDLLGIGAEFSLIPLQDEKMSRLRTQFSQTLFYAQLLNSELAAGSRLLAMQVPDASSVEKLGAAISKRSALLPGARTAAGSSGQLSAITSLDEVQAAVTKGDSLHELVSANAYYAFPEISDWVAVYANAIETLIRNSGQFLIQLTALAEEKARHADFLFDLAICAAAVLTALLLAREGRLNHRTLLALVIIAMNVPFITWRFASGSLFIADEGGVLEMVQVAMLCLAFVLFSTDAVRSSPALRSAAVVMACACLFMFFREMDFRTLGAPEWVVALSSGWGRRILFFIGLGILSVYAVANRRHLLVVARNAWSLRAWPLYLWPVLLLAGEAVELLTHATRKDEFHGYWSTGQFWEELLELDAYIVLVFAALVFSTILQNDPGKQAKTAKRGASPPNRENLSEQPVE